ncbi:hypothetical protein JCM11641_002981 [Rhodosporidiobolus odoratus]
MLGHSSSFLRASLRRQPARSVPFFSSRTIANNQVAPQFSFQDATQLDFSADSRDEAHERSNKGGQGGGGEGGGNKGNGAGGGGPRAAFESALATGAGIALLAGAGLCYHYWYKYDVLRKMERAFAPGYDPVLELATASARDPDGKTKKGRVRRKEQDYIDKIINGEITGEYLLMMGPKGVGKTSMLMDAMINNAADGCAMLEAHEDPEVFRLRLGKALDFEFHEDSFAGLFQRREPREAGPVLDIERALAKLEKVAIRYRRRRNRPMVMIIQNAHFIHDDEDGHALLHMLQQRAEAWAAAGVLTMVFLTDNFHTYAHLRRSATRMHVLSIRDLTPFETHTYLSGTHANYYPSAPPTTRAESLRIWDLIGGRLSFLSKIVERDNMEEAARDLVQEEKQWLLSRLGLIVDCDDDVMDEQKVASCSHLLFQHLAEVAKSSEPLVALALEKFEESQPHNDEEVEDALELDLLNALPDELDPKATYREAASL